MNKVLDIKKVGIAGAGTMGAGIAQVCATAGNEVVLFDLNASVLDKAAQNISKSLGKLVSLNKITEEKKSEIYNRIQYSKDINQLEVDLIIEAIIEKADAKITLFEQLMNINGENCIYATNTSSIPVTKIAAALPYKDKFLGIHFFNPAQIMKLVEIVQGTKTDPALIQTIKGYIISLGKVPVITADSPGFIVNRIARMYYVESLKIMEEGVADFETIDSIMESRGFKMGPFKLMDLIGVDTNYSVTESQYELFNHEARFRPSRIQKLKVDAGLHGRKSGEGFYKYED